MLLNSIFSFLLIGCSDNNVSDEKQVDEPSSEADTEEDTNTEDTEEPDGDDVDDDGDGFTENEGDCDDTDADLTPADNDGDGYSTCDDDCDDDDSSLHPADDDGDGQSSCEGDCDDQNALVFDGSPELCDGQFNDCDGQDSQTQGIPELESDDDGDGYVECEDTQSSWVTDEPTGYGDCDDSDETVIPLDEDGDGHTLCDNDCDDSAPDTYPGAAENESATSCMKDSDEDGYGDSNVEGNCCYLFEMEDSYADTWDGASLEVTVNGSLSSSVSLADGLSSGTDSVCVSDGDSVEISFISGSYDYEITVEIFDPTGASIYSATEPTAGQIYSGNAVCASTAPIVPGTDCDDLDAQAYSGAAEIWYDGIDQACDEGDDYDQDSDGYQSDAHGGNDCDDTNALVNIGMVEDQTDGIDNNCDGQIDEQFSTLILDSGLALSSGQPLTISADNQNNIHIAYHDGASVNYISKTNGSWDLSSPVPVDSSNTSGEHLRGIVDGLDRFQLAFTASGASGASLDFIHLNVLTQSWSNQVTLDQITSGSLDSEFQLDIDVDTANLPTIGYFRQSDDHPYMIDVTNFTTTPQTSISGVSTQLDENCLGFCLGYTGSYLSLAIDAQNVNHAVFFNYVQDIENQYNYTTDGSSSPSCSDWLGATSSYIEQDSVGIYNDVAIQNISGDVCVAYQDEDNEELMYACNSTSTCSGWTFESVDSNYAGAFASLVFNSNDEPYIAYYETSNGDLKIAHNDGIAWTITAVDSVGDVGKFIDMTIDSNDVVHIIYYDDTFGDLKYAFGQ